MPARLPWLLLAVGTLAMAGAGPAFLPAPPAVGDGETPVQLRLARAPARITLEVSAGTVRETRREPGGTLVIDYLPPRTAAAMQVQVVARGRGTRPARLTLEVLADPGNPAPNAGPFQLLGPPPLAGGPDLELVYSGAARSLRLWVSAGEAQALRAEAGRWQARYTPPPKGPPRSVIAAVTDSQGELRDWAVVPVLGQGQVEAITEPDATVRFRIGAEEFGPVRTDGSGLARMVVRAPPGVRQAVAVVTDRLGNIRERKIDLGAPAEAALLALCPPGGDRVVLLAIAPSGAPAAADQLEVTVAAGTVGVLRQLGPGTFEAAIHDAPLGADPVRVQVRWRTRPALEHHCALAPRPLPLVETPLPSAPARRLRVTPRLGLAVAGPRLTAPLALLELGWSPAALPSLTVGVQTGLTLTRGEYTTTTLQVFRATSWMAPLLARASWQLGLLGVEPYLGLHAGAALVGASTRSELTGLTSVVQALPAGGAAAGVHWPLGPGRVTGEVSYLRGWAPGFGPQEQLHAWFISGGYRLDP